MKYGNCSLRRDVKLSHYMAHFLAAASVGGCKDEAIANLLTAVCVACCMDGATANFLAAAAAACCKNGAAAILSGSWCCGSL